MKKMRRRQTRIFSTLTGIMAPREESKPEDLHEPEAPQRPLSLPQTQPQTPKVSKVQAAAPVPPPEAVPEILSRSEPDKPVSVDSAVLRENQTPAPIVSEPEAVGMDSPMDAPLPALEEAAPARPSMEPEDSLDQARPAFRLAAASHDFGMVPAGNSSSWQFTIFNDGEAELTLLEGKLLGGQEFALLDPPALPFTLPPRGSAVLTIEFAPKVSGQATGCLTIHSSDPEHLSSAVDLRGMGITLISTAQGVRPSIMANSLGMTFIFIPKGTFLMGSPPDEPGRNPDEIQHEVIISRPFYLQNTPVTQAQWQALMGSKLSGCLDGQEDCPVDGLSFGNCQEFLDKLNALDQGRYRLPTEAEWEYACRAGSKTSFANGEISKLICEPDPVLEASGWYCGNSERHSQAVAQKEPNAWGLYDMHGNVYEWCADWYGEYPSDPQTDPQGPPAGTARVVRGGSWFASAKNCRSAHRFSCPPRSKLKVLGFRLVCEV